MWQSSTGADLGPFLPGAIAARQVKLPCPSSLAQPGHQDPLGGIGYLINNAVGADAGTTGSPECPGGQGRPTEIEGY